MAKIKFKKWTPAKKAKWRSVYRDCYDRKRMSAQASFKAANRATKDM